MMVLDASATIEWLLSRPAADAVEAHLTAAEQSVHVPHLWGVEIAQVLRRLVAATTMTAARGRLALSAAQDLPATRYDHEPLLGRVWQLRHNLTAYDAVYVALAEALDAPLVTADARIASAPGHAARVVTIAGQ